MEGAVLEGMYYSALFEVFRDKTMMRLYRISEVDLEAAPQSRAVRREYSNVCDFPKSSQLAANSDAVLEIAEDTTAPNVRGVEKTGQKGKELVNSSSNDTETPDSKVRVPQTPLVDPDFRRYKKNFKLKLRKVTLCDVRKQKKNMQDGDRVHRRLQHE